MNKLIALGLVLNIGLADAWSQGRNDGSLYSRFGLGEQYTFASSRARALGGDGTALFSHDYMNFANPGAWSRQSLVRLSAGMTFDRIHAEDTYGNAERLMRGAFNAFQAGVPLLTNRLGLGLSFEPYSRMDYQVTTTNSLTVGQGDAMPYTVEHEGTGGLRRARVGVGLRVLPWLSIGASADFLFGITEESRKTIFDSNDFLYTNVSTSTRFHASTATGGLLMALRSATGEFTLGASATLPATLKADRALTLGESLDRDTLGTQITGEVKLPANLLAGASYRLRNNWIFAASMRFEPWTQASATLPVTGLVTGQLHDRMRISGGVEWIPAGISQLESYLARIAYRLGFYRDNLYVSPSSAVGTKIDVIAVTGGLGLPTLFAGTRVDLVFEIGTRGTLDQNLVRDRFVGLSATVNVGERWFVKRRLR